MTAPNDEVTVFDDVDVDEGQDSPVGEALTVEEIAGVQASQRDPATPSKDDPEVG